MKCYQEVSCPNCRCSTIAIMHVCLGSKQLFPCPANLDINIIRSLAIFRNDGPGAQIKPGL